MKVYHWNEQTDGPLSETGLINKLELLGYRCTPYTYPRGTNFPDHSHNTDKIDAVLKGKFKISAGKKTVILEAGDYVFIAAGEIHNAKVIGDESVVSIDAVKTG